jgi:SpoVK/Ycf46/Vps4 family AAA+-type ATPase
VRDAHDRYANQEVSYLLQRVEQFPGLVMLASNLKSNIDDAFLRRFQSVVHFPKPGPEERLRIWRRLIPNQVGLAPDLDLETLCRRYELTGSNIANIMQHCLVRSLARGDHRLTQSDVLAAIEREFQKEGKSA